MSAVRQNFAEACEAGINKQINMELYASYVYQSMAYHFDRDDIALEGMFKFMKKSSDEERGHAEMLMKYQNKRGGRIVLQDIKAPAVQWSSHVHALEEALALERKVNEALLSLHGIASANNDAHLCDYLEGNFLDEQVQSINELAKLIENAKRCGDGLGVYQFDKHSMGGE
jgi:ferritin heavy chain